MIKCVNKQITTNKCEWMKCKWGVSTQQYYQCKQML